MSPIMKMSPAQRRTGVCVQHHFLPRPYNPRSVALWPLSGLHITLQCTQAEQWGTPKLTSPPWSAKRCLSTFQVTMPACGAR